MKVLSHYSIIIILLISGYACNPNNEIKEAPTLKKYLTTEYTINTDGNTLNNACVNCLCIAGSFKINKEDQLAFIDYHPGIIYIYNVNKKQFSLKFKVPKRCFVADVFKVYNLDSILYFNNAEGILTLCDTSKIIKEYIPKNFIKDSNTICTYNENKLKCYNKEMVFDISVKCNNSNSGNYFDVVNSTPILGLFEFKENDLFYRPIFLYNQIKESDTKRIADNSIVYCIDEEKNQIIFSHKCSNEIFTYNFLTEKIGTYNISNTEHNIKTIYYNNTNSVNSSSFYEAANKQSVCSKLLFDKLHNNVIRIVNIRDSSNQKDKKYIQIIDSGFNLKEEFEIPKEYIEVIELNGSILFHRVDKKNNQIIYEKLNYPN